MTVSDDAPLFSAIVVVGPGQKQVGAIQALHGQRAFETQLVNLDSHTGPFELHAVQGGEKIEYDLGETILWRDGETLDVIPFEVDDGNTS